MNSLDFPNNRLRKSLIEPCLKEKDTEAQSGKAISQEMGEPDLRISAIAFLIAFTPLNSQAFTEGEGSRPLRTEQPGTSK